MATLGPQFRQVKNNNFEFGGEVASTVSTARGLNSNCEVFIRLTASALFNLLSPERERHG